MNINCTNDPVFNITTFHFLKCEQCLLGNDYSQVVTLSTCWRHNFYIIMIWYSCFYITWEPHCVQQVHILNNEFLHLIKRECYFLNRIFKVKYQIVSLNCKCHLSLNLWAVFYEKSSNSTFVYFYIKVWIAILWEIAC